MTSKRVANPDPAVPSPRRPRLRPLEGGRIALPPPETAGDVPVETCLATRRSVRDYAAAPVNLKELGQLLWAMQGVSGLGGLRTCPSAGAVYPLRTYVLAGRVDGAPAGLYEYDADQHAIAALWRGDKRRQLSAAAFGQDCVEQAAVAAVLTSDYRRIVRELGERGRYLTHVEAGHAGQNWLLEATALGLGAIGLGRFEPDIVAELLRLPGEEEPLYLLLAGRKAS